MKRGARGAGRGRAGTTAGSSRPAARDSGGDEASRSSSTPAPSRALSAAPARASLGASRATRAAPASVGRFRPKNVRRDEAERDSIAREEEKKAHARAAEERRARGRGRFRSKRSRGDAMGSRGGGRISAGAPNRPFSLGLGGSSRGGAGFLGSGGGGGGGFGSAAGSRVGGPSRTKGERDGPGFGVANESGYRETRINADKLHVMEPEEELDSDDEAMMTALSSRANVLPMGIYRREHKEAEVVVATTAELEAAENAGEEESLWVDGGSPDTQPPPEQPAEEGVWDTGDKKPSVVKKDPEDEPTAMDIDPKLDAAPENKGDKQKVEVKVKKAPPQDPEERIIQSDLELLASELGAVSVTENGETRTEGPTDKDGRMYLFQFPPLLPPLTPGDAPQPKSKVKAETEDFSMADAPPARTAHDGTPVDLTGEDGTSQSGKKNGNDQDDDGAGGEEEEEDRTGFMSSLLSEGGMVGQLNVRKSGKVELDWGGRILEMSPATGMNFLTTAVILEENDQKPAPGVVGGESIGMGKIMGRFVLAPVWGEEEEWDVDPEQVSIEQVAES